MTVRRFAAVLVAIALLALAMRTVYPAADPPWRTTVGIVWHDEGAWVHNARNKALYGAWRVDEWNPVFIAPVFTGLEYLSFKAFGVGVRQARLVSALAGVASVLLLALGPAPAAAGHGSSITTRSTTSLKSFMCREVLLGETSLQTLSKMANV